MQRLKSSVAKPFPHIISRTAHKCIHFSHKVAKYEKKVNTGAFGKGKVYIYTLQLYFTNDGSIKKNNKR